MCEAIAALLILSLIFEYWHNVLEAVQLYQIGGHFESLHQQRGGGECLSACTVFLHLEVDPALWLIYNISISN